MKTIVEPPAEDATRRLALSLYQDSLRMYKLQFLQQQFELINVQDKIQKVRNEQREEFEF